MDSTADLGVEDVFRFADVTTEEGGWLVVSAMDQTALPTSDAVSFPPTLDNSYESILSQDDLSQIEEDLFPEDVVRLLFLAMDNTPALVLQKCVVKMNLVANSKKTVDSFSEWACISTMDCNWKSLFLEGLAVIGRLDILDILGLNEQDIRKLQKPFHLSSLKVALNTVCCSMRQREMTNLVGYVFDRYLSDRTPPVFPDGYIIKQLLELYILFWMQEGIMDLTNLSVLAEALVHIGRTDLKDVLIGRPSPPSSVVSAASAGSQQGEHSKVVSLPSVGSLSATSVMYPNNRGVAVIFNQEQFRCGRHDCGLNSLEHHGLRLGSSIDAVNLQDLFTKFQCRTKIFKDLKASQIQTCLMNLSKANDLLKFDYLVVCFLSHGGTESGRQFIYGSDCQLLFVDNLVSHFEGDRCRALVGKMKMVITQSCQGVNTLRPVQADGPGDASASLPQCATAQSDFLFCQATTPGYKAYRDPRRGSFYIQRLCEVLEKRGHLEEVTLCIKDVHNLLIQSPIRLGNEKVECGIQPQMIDRTQGRFRFRRSEAVPPQSG